MAHAQLAEVKKGGLVVLLYDDPKDLVLIFFGFGFWFFFLCGVQGSQRSVAVIVWAASSCPSF